MEKTFIFLFEIKTLYCHSLRRCKITYIQNENLTFKDIKLTMLSNYPEWIIQRYRWNSSSHKKTLFKIKINYVVKLDFTNLKIWRMNDSDDKIMVMNNYFKIDDYEKGGQFFMRYENYNKSS